MPKKAPITADCGHETACGSEHFRTSYDRKRLGAKDRICCACWCREDPRAHLLRALTDFDRPFIITKPNDPALMGRG